jgi:hypothetical protein
MTDWVTYLLIILLVIFGIGVALTIPVNISPENRIPASCGLTGNNYSESYIIHNMCGMSPCPMTFYYRDLVCTNGTTILKYSSGYH